MDPRPHIAVVEDEAVQRRMLADYLARQNFRVSALGDGAALRRIAHRLAGSFALHGFRWAAHCCQQIEHAPGDADPPQLEAQLGALRRHLETVRITFGEVEA